MGHMTVAMTTVGGPDILTDEGLRTMTDVVLTTTTDVDLIMVVNMTTGGTVAMVMTGGGLPVTVVTVTTLGDPRPIVLRSLTATGVGGQAQITVGTQRACPTVYLRRTKWIKGMLLLMVAEAPPPVNRGEGRGRVGGAPSTGPPERSYSHDDYPKRYQDQGGSNPPTSDRWAQLDFDRRFSSPGESDGRFDRGGRHGYERRGTYPNFSRPEYQRSHSETWGYSPYGRNRTDWGTPLPRNEKLERLEKKKERGKGGGGGGSG